MAAADFCAPNGFAQIGPIELWHNYLEVFYEFANCANAYPPVEWRATLSGTHLYTVDHSISSGVAAVYFDGGSTPVKSMSLTGWNSADIAQFYGETHAEDDQMYGGTSDPGAFTNFYDCVYNDGYSCYNPDQTNVMTFNNVQEPYWNQTHTGGAGTMWVSDQACPN